MICIILFAVVFGDARICIYFNVDLLFVYVLAVMQLTDPEQVKLCLDEARSRIDLGAKWTKEFLLLSSIITIFSFCSPALQEPLPETGKLVCTRKQKIVSYV